MKFLAFGFAILFALGFLTVLPMRATAATTLYFVGGASGGCDTMLWSDSNCWSPTDSIPAGPHAPPTSADDAKFDTGSVGNLDFPHVVLEVDGSAFAHDVILAENNAGGYIQLTITGTLEFHSLAATGGAAAYYFGGDDGTTISFSGTIDGIDGNLGGANNFNTWAYTGSPPAEGGAQISNSGVFGMHASGATIYCSPGCTDYGDNVNVIFGPAPAPPASAPQIFPFAFLAIGLAALAAIMALFFAVADAEHPGEVLTILIGGMLGFVVFVFMVMHVLTG